MKIVEHFFKTRNLSSKIILHILVSSLSLPCVQGMATESSSLVSQNTECKNFFPFLEDGAYFWQQKMSYCDLFPADFTENYIKIFKRKPFQPNVTLGWDSKTQRPYVTNKIGWDYKMVFYNWTPNRELTPAIRAILEALLPDKIELLEKIFAKNVALSNVEEIIKDYKKLLSILMENAEICEAELQKFNSGNVSELFVSLEKMDETTEEYQETKTQLEKIYKIAEKNIYDVIFSKVLSSVIQARATFLEEPLVGNENILPSLIQNYFIYKKQADGTFKLERYRDDLNKSWLDLMPSDYYFGTSDTPVFDDNFKQRINILSSNPLYQSLRLSIDAYHHIPKMNINKISERIEALKNIARLSAQFIKENSQISDLDIDILQKIIVRANLKSAYIAKLPLIEQEAAMRSANLPKESGNIVVNVKQDRLKDIDPEKRQVGLLFDQWNKLVKENPDLPNYFLWLEGQDTTEMKKDLRHIVLRPEQKRVNFKNGLGYNEVFRDRKKETDISGIDTGLVRDGEYMYNIGENAELYIHPTYALYTMGQYPDELIQQEFNHDTILGGINVMAVGVLEFKDGKIIHIDTNSGHYLPEMEKHLRPALKKLLEKHPGCITDETMIGNYLGKPFMLYKDFVNASAEELEKSYVGSHSRPMETYGIQGYNFR